MGDDLRTQAAGDEAASNFATSSSSDLALVHEPTPVLIEALANGSRLGALLGPCGARLRRRLGVAGSSEGLILLPRELALLRAAAVDWVRVRDDWASFHHSCAGFKPGHGGAWWFTAPGVGSLPVRKGVHAVGWREGKPFRGVERPRALTPALAVAPGVAVVQELRRAGELETPPEGWRTGLVYSLGRGLELTAWREEARLARGLDEVWIERGEETFLAGLAADRA